VTDQIKGVKPVTAMPEANEAGNLEVLKGGTPEPDRRRRWWVPTVILGLVVLGGVALWLWTKGSAPATDSAATTELSFAEVIATDLVETSEYEGTMGRLEGDPVSTRLSGTVTALPEEGSTLKQGDVIAWIDNQPVILLYGALPVWRVMADDTEGPDVLQLETALTELGFNGSNSAMTVDETYSAATESVVEDWQEEAGAEDDGVVDLGEVIFLQDTVRVDALQVNVGDQIAAGSIILTTSEDDIEISFDLPTSEQDNVAVGDEVEITLPDLSTTTGVVTEIASVATRADDGSEAFFEATAVLDDPSVAEGIDEAPVTVAVITDRADDVMAVPVDALLALAEGGYAVEVADGSTTRLVGVEPGFYADGLVEIIGDVSPGDQVVVP
jgi:peptidoglycan hydrolase-like protein with peptidoglycan-binding domain